MAQETFFTLDGPLELVPGDGQCRAANFAGLAGVARNFGRDARGIVERHGMDPRVLSDPESLIAPSQLADTFEYCSTLFEDPLFGLHIASLQDPEVLAASPPCAAPRRLSAPASAA